jgi:TIGR03009 family protein
MTQEWIFGRKAMSPRYLPLAVVTLLLVATLSWAQQAQPTKPPAASRPEPTPIDQAKLDGYLQGWEQMMTKTQTLLINCTRLVRDKETASTETMTGTAKFMRPNLAAVELKKTDKPEIYERYICSGTHFFQFVPSSKVIRYKALPPPKQGQVTDDSFFSLLFGMKAEDAKKRYAMTAKEDQWYVYVDLLPRLEADKDEFIKARIVINKETFLPRQLWWVEKSGGVECTWDLDKVVKDTKLDRRDFEKPEPPAGWKLEKFEEAPPANTQPPVIRNQKP